MTIPKKGDVIIVAGGMIGLVDSYDSEKQSLTMESAYVFGGSDNGAGKIIFAKNFTPIAQADILATLSSKKTFKILIKVLDGIL